MAVEMTTYFLRDPAAKLASSFFLFKMQNGVTTVLLAQHSHCVTESESAVLWFLPEDTGWL